MKGVIYTNRRADRILEFQEDFPAIEWAVVWSPEEFEAEVGDADFVIFSNRICTPALGAALERGRTPSLKWIHFHSSGIERALAMGLPADIPVTTSAGAKATVCAEHAITLLLAASRRLWEIRAAQDRHYWARVELNFTIRSLEAGTLAVIGIGGIGREVARKAKAFDMTVIGVSRAPAPTANFDAVMPRQRMADALAQADAVIVTTSSDPANHRLIDAAALGAMKQSAYLVNVARGEIVDQAALVDALTSGGIAGAALDVTDPDPLPSESPLWDMENVIITPHVSAAGSRIGYERLRAIFAEELANLEAGTPFEHLYRGGG